MREVTIREEEAADAPRIRALLTAAFAGPAEAVLVDDLRADRDLVLGLVATEAEEVVGHIAFPRLVVETAGTALPAVGLAPLGVAPARQRNGIGSDLVRAGLAALADRGETLVFVLGDPAYYARFGFDLAAAAAYASPYAGPHFMACRLGEAATRHGAVRYPSAFTRLG